jgi:pimeloyl-ACP methyl ester carboxylesterase
VARDVDALRAALGERQISLYSRSYGTLAAQLYAELFPHRVRAVVLDSVFDHTQRTRQLVESSVRAAEDAFTAFADWCAASATCALHGQDVGAVFDELYRRAGRGELPDPRNPTRKITPFELSTTTTHAFYEPEWSTLSVRLATLAGQRAPQPAKSAAEAPALAPFPLAVFCADHRLAFQSEQDWQNLWDRLSQIAPHLRTHLAWQVVTLCAGWPLPPTNPQRPPRIHTTPPVLILNSRHDPATSIAWAIAVHRMINGSVLVTYQGSGHGAYLRTECTRTATEHYLIDLTLPNPGTHCPAADPT